MKLAAAIFFTAVSSIAGYTQTYPCIPADVKITDIVEISRVTSTKGVETATPVTVKQTLKKLKARCSHGKLLDRKGKQIRFYAMQGCWGNPPADYLEILEQQRKEIADLKKKYTVIEMTCNPSGMPPQSIS